MRCRGNAKHKGYWGAVRMADPIETRLLVIAEMLDRAVEEVHRVMVEIRGEPRKRPDDENRGGDDAGEC